VTPFSPSVVTPAILSAAKDSLFRRRRRIVPVVLMLVLAGASLGRAGAQLAPLPVDTVHATTPRPKVTRFIVAPYGWMAGISGETGVGDLSADVNVSFSDLLKHLRFAAMGTFEGGYGPWLGVVDVMYSSIRVDHTLSRGRIQPELDLTSKMLIAQAFAAYTVKPAPMIDVDILAGARLWSVKSTLAITGNRLQRTRERSPTWADAIGGGRLRWRVSPKWQINIAGDGGAGGSKATGEGMGTAGYRLSRHWDLFASYRYLYENYQKNDYFFTGHLSGPVIGGAYHW
jgi:hypothetical protein